MLQKADKMKFVVAALALLSVISVDARRGAGGARRGGQTKGLLPANAQNVYSWTQALVGQSTQEMAYSTADNSNIWIVAPNKRELKQQGYSPAKTVLDFTGGSLVAVMKLKKWCFRLPSWTSNTTRQSVIDKLNTYNGTTRAAATPAVYYVTDLDQAVVAGRPDITALCGSKPIQDLTTTASADQANPKNFLVATLSKAPVADQLSVMVAKKGRGGRRNGGGRRGGVAGRRNRNN